MINTSTYASWYSTNQNIQAVEEPIEFTLDGIRVLLNDTEVSHQHKAAARAYLASLKKQTYGGDVFACLCAIGAAMASCAYFMAMHEDPFAMDAWLIVPIVVFPLVVGSTWYTYRHDTTEIMLEHQFSSFSSFDRKLLSVGFITAFVFVMEIALTGYGIFDCLGEEGEPITNLQIGMVSFACLVAFIPELAQTYKYLKKWMLQDAVFESSSNGPSEDRTVQKWRWFYNTCSTIMMTFSAMAIYPLLEDQFFSMLSDDEDTTAVLSVFTIAAYVLLSMPYLFKKADEQIAYQRNKATEDAGKSKALIAQESLTWFNLARAGSVVGDLAFSAFGFFEAMKELGFIEKPADVFDGLSSSCRTEACSSWGIIVLWGVMMAASAVGAFLLTAGGNQKSYREKISDADCSTVEPAKNEHSTLFYMWHKGRDLPQPTSMKATPM